MSNFFSLDDDDAAAASSSAGPSRTDDRLPMRTVAETSNVNPIAALLHADRRRGRAYEDESSVTATTENQDEDGISALRFLERRTTPPIVVLRRAWANERASPVILQWQEEAVEGVCKQVEDTMTIIDHLSAEPSTLEEEHVRLGLVELDIERARWLLRSYLRCRIDKIEQHAAFVCEDPLSRNNLSPLERGYATKYAQICAQYYHASTLDFLPENMRSLDDKAASGTSGRGDMVTKPDVDAPVFVRCREDCGTFRFPGADLLVHFTKGSIHFVRFRSIEHLIAPGKVELL